MTASLLSCDTSVLVPALLPGHMQHRVCRTAIRKVSVIPGHVLLESYRVLTTLPGRDRVTPFQAAAALDALPWDVVSPRDADPRALIRELARDGRPGGPVYDAHIAASCHAVGTTLLTRDRRAVPHYELVGLSYRLVSDD
ncbi:hypothetical protein FM113_15045 [Leucobacter sp. 7(1)]|uniref:PIN domain-containing protein n=1 Tax=Leucobacter sp. 7(1) TaxID=1255613 RepID=UPI00097E8777|nr:PIN domain-containing protein [Leucobacter sp. 7(1)]SJN12486.1 hypothetical protein FM113_15045 [Leucobacter sp. 7(1)]